MKSVLFILSFVLSSSAFAASTPIKEDIAIESGKFSQMIFDAIAKNTKGKIVRTVGATLKIHKIGNGLSCAKITGLVSGGKKKISYSCSLLKSGGWKDLGSKSYGSGDNRRFSEALYEALDAEETKDEGFSLKSIQLEVPDGQGGTERNHLGCIKPTPDGEKFGLRSTCQIINAL